MHLQGTAIPGEGWGAAVCLQEQRRSWRGNCLHTRADTYTAQGRDNVLLILPSAARLGQAGPLARSMA